MHFSPQDLMEKIIELRIQLDYQIVELPKAEIEENIHYNAKELIKTFEQLRFYFPEEYQQFVQMNPKYKPLEIISDDNSVGFQQVINCITKDTEQTVSSIVKQVQTHEFHKWVKKNSSQEVSEVCETQSDKTLYVHMSQFNLPQVKQEEIGDCIALAFTGILSQNHETFQDASIEDSHKQYLLRKLMVDNRKYINWDFNSQTIEDQTEQYSQRKSIYRPRGVAAKKMIDSTYTDGKYLFAVVSTTNTDTSSQGAQAFEIYKTLQTNYENAKLDLELNKNLTPAVILFNNAFFCTENPSKIEHTVGRSEEKKAGYHHLNVRSKFDNLFEKPLGKGALDKINGLVTLSMIGNKNISWPRFPHTFDICDIIHCNPVTAGSDTLWLHTKFEQFKIYSNPQRTEKFFNFLLDYSNEVIENLLKAKENAQEPILDDVKSSFERLVSGITRNFNSYNLQRDLTSQEIEKIDALKDKIMDFNINQPNQTIDPNLFSSLTAQAFADKGTMNSKIISKRNDKFQEIQQRENENKENILEQIKHAQQDDKPSLENENVFIKLNAIGSLIYGTEGQGKSVQLMDYLNIIQHNLQLAEINKCDYLDVPKEHNPNYNYINNFLRSSGSTRKNFQNKIMEKEQEGIEIAQAYENTDDAISAFLRSFHTTEGRQYIIDNGGMVASVNKLIQEVEPYIQIINKNKAEITYETYKTETPFNEIQHRNLGSYWNLQVAQAEKHNIFDGMVAIIHEYLHRIEDQFKEGVKVSGKSLADLPKKIYVLEQMGKNFPHVRDATTVLIARYNYLGECFDEQHKDKKKYKPKNYRIPKVK